MQKIRRNGPCDAEIFKYPRLIFVCFCIIEYQTEFFFFIFLFSYSGQMCVGVVVLLRVVKIFFFG